MSNKEQELAKALKSALEEIERLRSYSSRPMSLIGKTVQTRTGCGNLYVTLNRDEHGKPFEVFFKLGHGGSCQQSHLEALGVAISVGLRSGAKLEKFIEKLRGVRCPKPTLRQGDSPGTLSCADAISQGLANALEMAVASSSDVLEVAEPLASKDNMGLCPQCGGLLIMQSGCEVCASQCGYTGRCG